MDESKIEKQKFENLDLQYADLEYITPQILIFISRKATPSWEIEESLIDFIDLTYVYEGEAVYTINGVDYHAKKGDLICVPAGSVRKAYSPTENLMKSQAVNFHLFNFGGEPVNLPLPILSPISKSSYLMELYRNLNQEWIQKKPGHILKCRATLMLILHEILDQLYFSNYNSFMDPRITRVLEYIGEHHAEKITVNSLAEYLGLSSVYFGVLFKNNMKISVKRYINQVRTNIAETLLLSGEYSIAEVAEQCGFDDVFYFSKVYKDVKGVTPSTSKKTVGSIERN